LWIIFIWCSEIYLANQSDDILLLLSIVAMSESVRKVWRSCKSKRKKQYKKKQKRCGLGCSGRVSSSCLSSGTRCMKRTMIYQLKNDIRGRGGRVVDGIATIYATRFYYHILCCVSFFLILSTMCCQFLSLW
jgi:hypothetical protein